MEWQPISTAPKDGTEILAWTDTREGDQNLLDYVNGVCEGEHLSCVQIIYWADGWKRLKIGEPTHWQPLPNPPSASTPPAP